MLNNVVAAAVIGALVGSASPHRPTTTSPLVMVEHKLPLTAAHRYEAALHEAMADRGSVLRWYIARVDETTGSAIAECVLLQHNASGV
jgi:hypothetical protein